MSVYFVILLSVLSSIAYRGSKVLVSLDALHLGANSFMVGVLAALYALFPLLLAVYAGRISDRIGVRYPILFGSPDSPSTHWVSGRPSSRSPRYRSSSC